MRYAVAVAVAALLTAVPAYARPWATHPYLNRPEIGLAESPDEGPSGERTVVGYFEKLDRSGFACDAQDAAARRIKIVCANKRGNTIAYSGQFVGAGYLDITQATINGRRLNKAELISHQTVVWNGDLRSPSQ